jgi:hypothetical protein
MLTADRHADIMLIYRWFQAEMHKAHKSVQFPKKTDPTKTYLYRSLSKFHAKVVEEMDLSHAAVKKVIESAVKHGQSRNILSRGANLLNMTDILDVCQKRLETEHEFEDNMFRAIADARTYLDRHRLNSVLALSSPTYVGGYSNLYQLVENGTIPLEYLALSRTVTKALARLPMDERSRLPSDKSLVVMRLKMLVHMDKAKKLQEVMGEDLYLIPLECH